MATRFKDLMRESAESEAQALAAAKEKKSSTSTPKKKESIPKEPKEDTELKKEKPAKKKNPGGRPKNAELGLACRKQYTLTLEENTYKTFLEMARAEKLSFAKFMEKAALEYIENNK